MPIPQEHTYTSEDYWNLPEGQRAELIDGKLYAMAPPSFIHQKLIQQLGRIIGNHIFTQNGECEVVPAPFVLQIGLSKLFHLAAHGWIILLNCLNIVPLAFGNIGS